MKTMSKKHYSPRYYPEVLKIKTEDLKLETDIFDTLFLKSYYYSKEKGSNNIPSMKEAELAMKELVDNYLFNAMENYSFSNPSRGIRPKVILEFDADRRKIISTYSEMQLSSRKTFFGDVSVPSHVDGVETVDPETLLQSSYEILTFTTIDTETNSIMTTTIYEP